MLSRRRLLATIGSASGVGIAGCLGGDDTPPEYPDITIEPEDSTRENVEFTATVLRAFDNEAPARIRIAFENAGDERQEFIFGPIRPFEIVRATRDSGDERLFLDPESGTELWPSDDPRPDEPVGGCWKLTDDILPAIPDITSGATLDPGEELTNEYDVYAGPDDCLTAGEYRFGPPSDSYDWGLVVTLTD